MQRVLSILITNPTINPTDIHLQHTILGEPLHNLKGHLSSVYRTALSSQGWHYGSVNKLSSTTRVKKCADIGLTAIQMYFKLRQKLSATDPILLLMETAVRISDILYLYASARSPKRVLELYNCTCHTM